MSYQVLARRCRPQSFTEVIGQRATVNTLAHSLDQNRLHQAYLFTGTRGVGKTSIARILAKCLNCETKISSKPCGECSACTNIPIGQYIDLIEIDAASHTKVEDIRSLLDNIPYRPTNARFKIYLIDEVHMLSTHSFNALLKTLEEPPEYVKFILCTTDPQKLPATILSRCLRFHLHNLSPEEIKQHLATCLDQEKIAYCPEALSILSEAADGSMRDALSLLDQAIAHSAKDIQTESISSMLGLVDQSLIQNLLTAVRAEDASAALDIVEEMSKRGYDFAASLEQIMRECHQTAIKLALATGKDKNINLESNCHLYYEIAARGIKDLELAPTPRIGFEMTIMRLLAFRPTQTQLTKPSTGATDKIDNPQTTATPKNHEWNNELIQSLNINGITLQIANNCLLTKQEDNIWHLTLAKKCKPLLNQKQQTRLEDAIAKQTKQKVKLEFSIAEDDNKIVTIESTKLKQAAAKQKHLSTLIDSDSNSQRIIQAFNAEIVAGSISSQEANCSKPTGEKT